MIQKKNQILLNDVNAHLPSDNPALKKARAKGKPVKASSLKVVHSKSKDLMSQLKASLGKRKKAS